MKKYRVTDKHPVLKNTTIISVDDLNYKEYDKNGDLFGSWSKDTHLIDCEIENGWIEEIYEPEFTRKDLDSLLKFYMNNECNCKILNPDFEVIIKKWIRATKTF